MIHRFYSPLKISSIPFDDLCARPLIRPSRSLEDDLLVLLAAGRYETGIKCRVGSGSAEDAIENRE